MGSSTDGPRAGFTSALRAQAGRRGPQVPSNVPIDPPRTGHRRKLASVRPSLDEFKRIAIEKRRPERRLVTRSSDFEETDFMQAFCHIQALW